MVNPLRTPTISPNNLISSATAHTVQLQTLAFELKQLLVAAGATILISNGGGTAGAGDNIPNAAAVTTGLAGTGCWFVAEFANLGGAALRILFNVNDNAAPIQSVQWRAGDATWTGGSTTTLPTVNTGFATTAHTMTLHPFVTAVNVRWTSWRTANAAGAQTIRFAVKEGGVSQWATYIVISGNTDLSGGGIGFARWWMFIPNSTSPLTGTTLITATTAFEGVNSGSTASAQPRASTRIWDISTSWVNGLNMQSRENLDPILLGSPSAAGSREMGSMVDTYAIPVLSTFGIWSDSAEATAGQPFQRKNMGVIADYWPAGIDIL